jgi:GR25 family glycosyltransferase involved in LPS biosynthesis
MLPRPIHAIVIREPTSTHPLEVEASSSLHFQIERVSSVDASVDLRWTERSNTSNSLEIGLGAAGCLLAHRDAWRKIAKHDEDDYFVVLESDAVLTTFGRKNISRILEQSANQGANLVQLATGRGHKATRAEQTLGLRLARSKDFVETRLLPLGKPRLVQAYGMGTIAYALRPEYARWLTQQDLGFGLPVDNWFRVWSLDARHAIYRCRQDCWRESGRASSIENSGRL